MNLVRRSLADPASKQVALAATAGAVGLALWRYFSTRKCCSYDLLPRELRYRGGKKAEEDDIKIVQFNTLADGLSGASPNHGGFAYPEGLEWNTRKHKLLYELVRSGGDVLCLQEVDHFHDWFEPQLKMLGYKGVFRKKPNSPCLRTAPGSGLEDGCAIFYKAERFGLIYSEDIVYDEPTAEELRGEAPPQQQKEDMKNKSNQVGLLAWLVPRKQGASGMFLVACTHLKAEKTSEASEQARASQIRQLLNRIQNKSTGNSCLPIPVVVCSDMNAEPIGTRYPPHAYNVVLSHPLALHSAYAQGGAEPAYTTAKFRIGEGGKLKEAKMAIDYIFHSKELECVGTWSIPSLEDMNGTGIPRGLPQLRYPSDHFAIMAVLRPAPTSRI